MTRRGTSRKAGLSPGQLRAIMGLSAVALVVAYILFGDAFKRSAGIGTGAPPPRAPGSVRVVSWNLRNFPGEDQDRRAIARELGKIDADVVALQEVLDVEAIEELLPGYEFVHSESGGRGEQYLAIGVRKGETLLASEEHPELAMGGSVRPALSATAQVGPHRFEVVTVHLKATPDGYDLRERQWRELDALARAALEDGDPLLIVGDFNATGARDGGPAEERTALSLALEPLEPAFPIEGCSAYWEGERRDVWKEPSLLDFGFASGVDVTATVRGTCGRHRCKPLRSSIEYPNPNYEDLSDHCPVIFDITW